MNKIPNTSGNGFKLKRNVPEEYSSVFHVDVVEEEEAEKEPVFDDIDDDTAAPDSDPGDDNFDPQGENVSCLSYFVQFILRTRRN